MGQGKPLDSNAFFRTESDKMGAGAIRHQQFRNIQGLASLLGNMAQPFQAQAEAGAVQRGNVLKGDLESALAGKGAQATGLGRIAASSARGSTSLALSKQRQAFAQMIMQLSTQGGLQMSGQQVQAFGSQPQPPPDSNKSMPDWAQSAAQGVQAAAMIAAL